MTIHIKSFRYIINIFAALTVFMIAGCQDTMQTVPASSLANTQSEQPEPAVPVEHSEKYIKEGEYLKKCQAQLEALKIVAPQQYNSMQSSFDYLMKSAAQYTRLRESVNENTQDTVDSLYHYRANQLCSRIAQTLLDSLTSKGEARQ